MGPTTQFGLFRQVDNAKRSIVIFIKYFILFQQPKLGSCTYREANSLLKFFYFLFLKQP